MQLMEKKKKKKEQNYFVWEWVITTAPNYKYLNA